MVAVGEKLCNLEQSEDSNRLDANNTCVFVEQNTNWDEMPEDFATTAADIAANKILADPHGQTALKTIHRFLSYNSEWLQKTLGVTVREVDTLLGKWPTISSLYIQLYKVSCLFTFSEKSVQSNENIPVEQPKLLPWEDDVFRTPSPKEMVMHCCK